ncbi:MAG: sel1 repeat family protein [Verrucomicrobia bacterium]|nr:sel1 repeat family protein [Verrucomicrobiota bacterium]
MVTFRGAVGVNSPERPPSWSPSRSWACRLQRDSPPTRSIPKRNLMGVIVKGKTPLAILFLLAWSVGGALPGWGQEGKDYSDALRAEAEGGDREAQFRMGNCLFFGLGISRNQGEGVAWYRKAAEQGHAEAQFNLGGCFLQGYGVAANAAEAVRWWRESAGQGFPAAQISLGDCLLQGRGTERDEREAVRWYQKSADLEYPAGLYRLGNCYMQGVGVGRDVAAAVRCYRRAAEQNFEPAIRVLHKLEEQDSG